MLCRSCTVQIQPRKHVLDHADYAAPTRQHEVDHTDQEFICSAWQIYIIKWESMTCPTYGLFQYYFIHKLHYLQLPSLYFVQKSHSTGWFFILIWGERGAPLMHLVFAFEKQKKKHQQQPSTRATDNDRNTNTTNTSNGNSTMTTAAIAINNQLQQQKKNRGFPAADTRRCLCPFPIGHR